MQPKNDTKKWDLVPYCDSDWIGDIETRTSVTRFIMYLRGVLICWGSKGQKGVTLWCNEPGYVAISKQLKKFVFFISFWTVRMLRSRFQSCKI
jgi:hypothetical protein